MAGETGDSSTDTFAIDLDGDYGTLDPRFFAQTPTEADALRDEKITPDSIGDDFADAVKKPVD